jgi:hypothetical protein
MSLEDIAKRNQQFALDEQAFALKRFPESKSVGEALAKWHATDAGRAISASYSRDYYRKNQLADALANQDTVSIGKIRVKPATNKPIDWSDDKAASAEYRRQQAEQAASLSDEHKSQRHNGAGRIGGMGERVNEGAPEATQRRPTGLGDARDEAAEEARFVKRATAHLMKRFGVDYDRAISAVLAETKQRRGW